MSEMDFLDKQFEYCLNVGYIEPAEECPFDLDILAKQLEYCINFGYIEPAKQILNELIEHRAQLDFTCTMNFKCTSHNYNFNQEFAHADNSYFYLFKPCLHVVCWRCIDYYFKGIFNRVGLHYNYICPGCFVSSSFNPTPISNQDQLFLAIIPADIQNQWIKYYEVATMTLRNNFMVNFSQSMCFFNKNKNPQIECPGVDQTEKIPGCGHRVCRGCIEKCLNLGSDAPPFKCFVIDCCQEISDAYVKSLLTLNNDKMKRIFLNLRIEGISHFFCPNCDVPIEVESHALVYNCKCGKSLCVMCGKYSHGDFFCRFAEINEKQYQKIECFENDIMPDSKSYYFQACQLFEWDLEPKKKASLMSSYKIKFKVKRVFKIFNPNLQELYEKHKADLLQKGIDPDERWVFHGTQDHLYDEICQNGFKIGGIDVDIKIGKAFGYGVSTSTDPTMCIAFYANKKIILCKGLTGIKSKNPINDKNEFLRNTEYHSYFKDFAGIQSNYYIFCNSQYVLPFYYIEYE